MSFIPSPSNCRPCSNPNEVRAAGVSLLRVEKLTTEFKSAGQVVRAADHVSFSLKKGEFLALVGESGCGKTVTALSILGLLPAGASVSAEGVYFDGCDLLRLSARERFQLRGRAFSMVFQEAMTCLCPVFTVGRQLGDVFAKLHGLTKEKAREEAIAMLRRVRLSDPARCLGSYPYELSGGMRQRVMIAMALACRPKLLVADEPTTALDVRNEAEIIDLLDGLRREFETAILLITHDLGLVGRACESVMVMYAGRIVEKSPVRDLLAKPLHPYTQGLLASAPKVGRREKRLAAIKGAVPDLARLPGGCRFHDRCAQVVERCRTEDPPLFCLGGGREVACWLAPNFVPYTASVCTNIGQTDAVYGTK